MWQLLLISFFIQAAGPKVTPATKAASPAATSTKAKEVSVAAGAVEIPLVAHKAIVGVNGMVCSFCAQGIEKKFKARPEVAGIQVDLDNKKVTVDFKNGLELSDEVIKSIIIQEAGYQVVSIIRE